MRTVFLIFILVASDSLAIAQEAWGTIIFKNVGVLRADGTSYNIPIWMDTPEPHTVGAGLSLGGLVTAGLFKAGSNVPLATSTLGTTAALSPYLANPISQTVSIPGVMPGETTILVVRMWQGGSFESAKSTPGYQYGEWTFMTKPLGGVPPGGAKIPTPTLSGWGPEDGSGFVLAQYIENFSTMDWDGLSRVFASPARLNVRVHWILDDVVNPSGAVTNFSIFANSTLVGSQTVISDTPNQTPIEGLGAGKYSLVAVVYTRSGRNIASDPVDIAVVDPVAVAVSSSKIQYGLIAFDYTVDPGLKYVIESSSDLQIWQPVLTNVPTANPAQFSDGYSPDDRRFYRVGRLPNP